jgi:hypothetical protein
MGEDSLTSRVYQALFKPLLPIIGVSGEDEHPTAKGESHLQTLSIAQSYVGICPEGQRMAHARPQTVGCEHLKAYGS